MVNVSDGGKRAEAAAKQRESSKRVTLDALKSKRGRTREVTVHVDGEEATLLLRSIGARDYDRLVAKHPPTRDQLADGATFNIDTFGPALISACSLEPEISPSDAQDLWDSPEWSRGDLMYLFSEAVRLNNEGLNVPFTANA